MAGFTDILIKQELRPCIVDDRKALFHKLINESWIVEPSVMVGGHNGGVIKTAYAIVEFEDGTVIKVNPTRIKFCDNKISEYCFEGDKDD